MSNFSKVIDVNEFGPHININNYNSFFHENICHVCKKVNNGSFISCNLCDMISYCTPEHSLMHRPQHMQICEYIIRVLRENKIRRDCALSLFKWIQLRQQFLSSIKKWIPRKLKLYEEQMILFAKSCSICHRQINLEHCQTCYSDYYCSEHIQEFQELQADFNNEWTCSRSIFLSGIRHCPLILTTTSAKKAEQNVSILKQIIGSYIQPLYSAQNPLRSWRPWRDLETGSVYFRNHYVTVYRNTLLLSSPY
ncbi:uncharacterized protein LOC116849622 isoform X4 [Odontomachus brunneus]|uniref:uncharacterized protein LOC116849622 isoform X3 n=1 Tax=Odontomachus brunneus TaxID=486640 RepID=UPI0013F1D629|nr:uncharacterized protein LOC116849622 isoform X3 [Odontomachus brunneus]XP_032682841.1 uncharacterized protein LOC116849622 isoform X4 [Odontomachus brunneus]